MSFRPHFHFQNPTYEEAVSSNTTHHPGCRVLQVPPCSLEDAVPLRDVIDVEEVRGVGHEELDAVSQGRGPTHATCTCNGETASRV